MDILLSGEFEAAELHAWQQSLRAALPEARWLSRAQALAVADAVQVAVVANPPPGSLLGLPKLRLIQSLWAGVDRLLDDPTLPPDVPIARMVDPALSAAMAETALWATLALHRGFFDNARAQREGLWLQQAQRRAGAVQVLVLGLGEMGTAAARRIAQLGYRVRGWSLRPRGPVHAAAQHASAAAPPADPVASARIASQAATQPLPPSQPLHGIDCHHGADALLALLPGSGVVINLLPLTAATRGLLDARFFAALPRGAGIVNLARGAHVVDADLLAALDSGHVQHAVLDVFHTEPLPAGHAFWSHPRVTVLPHVAALTDPASASALVADNVRALFDGRALQHLVDRARAY